MAQVQFCDIIRSSAAKISLPFALSSAQQCLYKRVVQKHPHAFLAGGYVAHNIGLKIQHADADCFIGFAVEMSELKKLAEDLNEYIQEDEGKMLKEIHCIKMSTSEYWHGKTNRPFIRLYIEKYNFDVILCIVPNSIETFSLEETKAWTSFYIIASFDLLYSKCAILELSEDFREGSVIRLGDKMQGLNDVQLRHEVVEEMYATITVQIASENNDPKSLKFRGLLYLHASLSTIISRLEKYMEDVSSIISPEVSALSRELTSIAYKINPDAFTITSECFAVNEKAVTDQPRFAEILRRNEADLVPDVDSTHRFILDHNLPSLPPNRICDRCRLLNIRL